MTTRPDYGFETLLPSIPAPNANNLTEVVAALREAIQVRTGAVGDGMDRAVTLRDLLNSGVATPFDLRNLGNGGITPFPIGTGDTDPDMPPTPDHLEASGAIKYIILTWNFARGYSRLAYFEVWRSLTDNISDAIQIGQTFAPIYADNVGPGKSYYYWVRAVSDVAASPFNSFSGTLGQTSIDVEYVLELLTGQITETQLWPDLGDRIDLIDGAATLIGSVNQRVEAAKLIAANAIAALDAALDDAGSAIIDLQHADADMAYVVTALGTRLGSAESTITTLNTTTAGQAMALQSLNTRVGSAESSINTLNTTTAGQASATTALTTRVGTAESNLVTLNSTTAGQATAITALSTRTDTAEGAITTLQSTSAGQAQSITNLTSTVGGYSTSIQTLQTTMAGVTAQYMVKLDNNGYTTGFGGSSTLVNGVPVSTWIFRTDTFAIGAPGGPGVVAPQVPFIVRTTVSVINGVTVPIGVYIADAFIANGTITNAKIGDLQVDDAKIANMSVAKLIAGKLGIGEYIESTNYLAGDTGFRIHGNGNAEFNNVTVRGTVYATAGRIANVNIGANAMFTSNYGATSGWAMFDNGTVYFNQARIRGELVAAYGTLGTITAMTALSGTSGARTVMTERGAICYDANNTRRCQWGDLSV